jgi:acyl-CoA reductase-like NAD-dependent aldehyde dehydrogenase
MSLRFPAPLDALSSAQVLALEAVSHSVHFPASTRIFEVGGAPDCCYVVDNGLVRIEVELQEVDSEGVVAYVEPGQFLGELALLDDLPRSASAYADTEVSARRIDRRDLERLGESDPAVARAVYAALGKAAATKLRSMTTRFAEAVFHEHSADADAMLDRAEAAQRRLEAVPEAKVDEWLAAMSEAVFAEAEPLAEETVAETGIGRAADKAMLTRVASRAICASLSGQPGFGRLGEDAAGVTEYGSPAGVIFGIVPVTVPVAVCIFKSLLAVKARNAIVLSPSRQAVRVSTRTTEIIRNALAAAGAPADLVQCISRGNSRRTNGTFMRHPKVSLILATGGASMVEAAYSSGTPAIGVGPGNTPTLVCSDADPDHVARCVVASKGCDNGLSCASEHNLVVVAGIVTALCAAFEVHGAAVLSESEAVMFVAKAIQPTTHHLRPEVVGQDADKVARFVGVERPYPIRLIVVPTRGIDAHNPLAFEKMAPVTSLFTVPDESAGIVACQELLKLEGAGHTGAIHTNQASWIDQFATRVNVSRIVVCSPSAHGGGGLTTALPFSLSLGCGTFGGNSTTDNVTYRHLMNVKRLARYLPEKFGINV